MQTIIFPRQFGKCQTLICFVSTQSTRQDRKKAYRVYRRNRHRAASIRSACSASASISRSGPKWYFINTLRTSTSSAVVRHGST
jgi:hypothetical protein